MVYFVYFVRGSNVELIIGYWLDGQSYPDAWTKKEASMGEKITGFQGLISLLEVQSGYILPTVAETTRTAEWQAAIERLNDGQKPYSKSFQVDSWHTAQELKQRRDELVLSGWKPELSKGSEWLQAYAEIEQSLVEKSFGFADRVKVLLDLLEAKQIHLQIRKIKLVEHDRTLLDSWMQRLLCLLEENQVVVEQYEPQANLANEALSDLQKVKASLNGQQEIGELTNDGTFLIVQAEQEWDLADFLASYLQLPTEDDIVLINPENDVLLSELFQRRGLAASNVTTYSQARSVLQILPLVIETYWQPIRVEKLLELFTLPISPVPRTLTNRLARALAEEPGIGGEKWQHALDEGKAQLLADWQADETISPQKLIKKIEELYEIIALYIEHPFYQEENGIKCETVERICAHLARWANKRYILGGDIYLTAKQIMDDLVSSLQALEIENISKLQLTNIYNAVIGEGAKLTNYKAQLSNWTTIHKPGAIFDQVQQVLWWQFIDRGGNTKIKWTQAELNYLAEHGVNITPKKIIRKRESVAWQTALEFTKERFICFIPSKVRGEDVKSHPLLDEFKFAFEKLGAKIGDVSFDAKLLKYGSGFETMNFERQKLLLQNLPSRIQEWHIPKERMTLREKESATSLETLLRCPLDWTLKYGAKIVATPTLSLPNESRMLGNLGHKILEHLIEQQALDDITAIELKTEQLFEELVPQMAAPLLLPEQNSNRRRVLDDMKKSMRQFARFVQEAEISIRETEKMASKQWEQGVLLEGRLDLYGKTKSGRPLIFDAKWSRQPRRYKALLEQGAIQLAIYHWLLAEQESDVIPIAYFMLSSGDVYALPDEELPVDKHCIEGKGMQETILTVRQQVEVIMQELAAGRVAASGLCEEETRLSSYEPNCKFCDYQQLCGKGVASV